MPRARMFTRVIMDKRVTDHKFRNVPLERGPCSEEIRDWARDSYNHAFRIRDWGHGRLYEYQNAWPWVRLKTRWCTDRREFKFIMPLPSLRPRQSAIGVVESRLRGDSA